MRIAIWGATSQIAKDLILSFSTHRKEDLVLFARRPDTVTQWTADVGLLNRYVIDDLKNFSVEDHFDAILNFVGVGNPAHAAALGATIFDITLHYDELALQYVRRHPDCRYLFLSSGAAYGSSFTEPVNESTMATVAINSLQPHDWYSVAKMYAECRHRSLSSLPIVDIRVFNYFSHTQDISARFLITDIVRSIRFGETLTVSKENIVRDYIGPNDFCQLISLILDAPCTNNVVDCYTQAPIDKLTLLSAMKAQFGLRYELSDAPNAINATGLKRHYYSRNFRAQTYGYSPSKNSLETVIDEARIALT
jgi:nucleoside-diphosphate-sugar epimerase